MDKLPIINDLSVKGQIKVEVIGSDGILKDSTGWISNTIMNTGKAALAGLAGNVDSQVAFTYLAVGTDTTAPAATQTTLVAEISDSGLERVAGTVTRETTTVTNDTLQLYKEFTASGTKTVEEVGIFNDATTGIMLGRALTTSKDLVSGDKLQVTYQVKFA